KSRAGIVIPATAAESRRLGWAKVVAVGPTVRNVEDGDLVLFAPDAGFEVDIRGEDSLILRERDVHAVASSRTEGQTGLYLGSILQPRSASAAKSRSSPGRRAASDAPSQRPMSPPAPACACSRARRTSSTRPRLRSQP